MKVDLPAPGAPEIPTRMEFPVWGSSVVRTRCARTWWSLRVDSMRVMVFASERRFFLSTPSTSCWSTATSDALGVLFTSIDNR